MAMAGDDHQDLIARELTPEGLDLSTEVLLHNHLQGLMDVFLGLLQDLNDLRF